MLDIFTKSAIKVDIWVKPIQTFRDHVPSTVLVLFSMDKMACMKSASFPNLFKFVGYLRFSGHLW